MLREEIFHSQNRKLQDIKLKIKPDADFQTTNLPFKRKAKGEKTSGSSSNLGETIKLHTWGETMRISYYIYMSKYEKVCIKNV